MAAMRPQKREASRFPEFPRPLIGGAGISGKSCGSRTLPVSGISGKEAETIRAWLALIGETEPECVAQVLAACAKDPEALGYFLSRAVTESPKDREQTERDRENTPSSFSGELQMLTVSAETSGTFEMPPAGPVASRCCRLVDLGSQESEFNGEKKLQRKLLISWELAELRTDGSPFQVSRRFGLSLHEKSSLRQFLQAWRGRPFSDEELAGFDLRRLLNAPAMLNIMHTNRNGKDYANIASISPLPKGMSAPELAGPAVVFDIDAGNAVDVLETLSDNLQTTIAASPEWQARIKRGEAESAAPFDDDVCF